jgi:PA domain
VFRAAISAADIREEISWLADPKWAGRFTGSPGAEASAQWLAGYFGSLGLETFGPDYFEKFSYTSGVKILPGANELSVGATALVPEKDFVPLSFSDNGKVEGEVVFAGYGLSVPEGNGGRYNSYEGLDVKDKVVLILRYVPESVDAKRRAQLNRYAGLRYKAMLARERGAKAVLFVSGPNSPQSGSLIALTSDHTLAGSGILAYSISVRAAELLLAPSGGLQAGALLMNERVTS